MVLVLFHVTFPLVCAPLSLSPSLLLVLEGLRTPVVIATVVIGTPCCWKEAHSQDLFCVLSELQIVLKDDMV